MPDPSPDTARSPRGVTLGTCRDVLLIVTLTVVCFCLGAKFLVPLTLAVLVCVIIAAISNRVKKLRLARSNLPQWFGYLVASVVVLFAPFAVKTVL